MAISLGKSTGDSSRKTSRRLLSQYGIDSTIATKGLTAPGIKVSAPIVDTYQQVERMNAPQLQLGQFADMSVGFDNSKDLQNLANSLGQFNSSLKQFGSAMAQRTVRIDKEAKNYSKSLALQNLGKKKSAVEILQDTRQNLQKIRESEEATIEQKKAAEKNLNYIDSRNNILIPHLQSQNKIINIQSNAATLSSKAAGATVITPEGIEVPLNSLRPDDPLYLEWRKNTVYGDGSGGIIPLNQREGNEVSATVLSAYANDINRQEKAVIAYNKDVYEKESLVHVDALAGMHIEGSSPDDVVKQLNAILDDSRFMQLYRTKEDRDKFVQSILTQWNQKLLMHGLQNNKFLEAEEAFKPWEQLMTGKKEDRLVLDKETNTEVINENLRWYKGQDPGWLINTQTAYTKALGEFKKLNKTTQEQKGTVQITNRFTEEILPLYKKIDELAGTDGFDNPEVGLKLQKANEQYEQLKSEIIATVPLEHQAAVLKYANTLQKTNDALFFGAERTQLKNDLRKEYRKVFQNPRLAIGFRQKVTGLTNTGAIPETFGMDLINKTNSIAEGIATPSQNFANKLIKERLDKWNGKDGFYRSSKSGSTDYTLEELGVVNNAELKMINDTDEIIQNGLKEKKTDGQIQEDLLKYFTNLKDDEDLGFLEGVMADDTVGVSFNSVEDFKNQYLGRNYKSGISNKEAGRLKAMYNSNQPMFSKKVLVELFDDYNSTGKVDPDIRRLINKLGIDAGIDAETFFKNQLTKAGLTDVQVKDKKKLNEDYSMSDKKPRQLSTLEKLMFGIAFVPTSYFFSTMANAGELRSADPYNYQPAEGTQTVSDMLKISLTSDFTEDEAVIMAAIGMAESSGRPLAHNTEGDDNSYGLFQINMLDRPGFMMGEERRGQFGLDSNEQLFDPLINGKAAKFIYDMQGFEAWTVYRTGAYLKYLPAAQEALNSLSN
tara:strand:- start:301 stop:3132 length:2832 start_codon:yes stop_codon:yes gene_type:complete